MKTIKCRFKIKSALLVNLEKGDLVLDIDPMQIDEKILEELK